MTQAAMRLSRADRRAQLLDVAASLIVERGPSAVTIERVAAEAGVSRALTYQHFDNSDEVLVALYRREVHHLGEAILAAVDRHDDPTTRMRAAISTFLDVVGERQGVFTVLAAAGSTVPTDADDGTRAGQRFAQGLFEEIFGLPSRRAKVAAAMTFGAMIGGVEAWVAGELRRSEVETAVMDVAMTFVAPGTGRR